MTLKARDFFFPYWFLAALGGAALGWAAVWGGLAVGLAAGGLGGWLILFIYLKAVKNSRNKFIQKLSESLPENSSAREALSPADAGGDPVEASLGRALDRIQSLESKTGPVLAAPDFPWQEFSNSMENLAQEEEKMAQTFHMFKEVIRDWSSNIEKAGRINKSLLQLNALIVNDSKKVAADTDEAARSATDGIKSVGKEIKAMTEIKATIGSSAEVIQQLNLASAQIGDFLVTITSIARKTNLLALNAGIEAARAGEHGQGFAVVATEIKTLAEASAKASGDVKHLVDDIRAKTTSAISLINTTGKIEENVNVVYSAGDVFMNIVKSIRKAGGLLGEISQALDDQRNDNELLVQLINKISMAGDHVRERFELVEQSLEMVQKLSRKMKTAMDNFKSERP